MLFNRQINGTVGGGSPDFVFNMNQEYKMVLSQTLQGDNVS